MRPTRTTVILLSSPARQINDGYTQLPKRKVTGVSQYHSISFYESKAHNTHLSITTRPGCGDTHHSLSNFFTQACKKSFFEKYAVRCLAAQRRHQPATGHLSFRR